MPFAVDLWPLTSSLASRPQQQQPTMAFGDFLHDKCCFLCAENPKKAITYGWFTAIVSGVAPTFVLLLAHSRARVLLPQALVLVAFILACVVASASASGSSNQALGFAAVWTVLLLIALSVGGTLVMRQVRAGSAWIAPDNSVTHPASPLLCPRRCSCAHSTRPR